MVRKLLEHYRLAHREARFFRVGLLCAIAVNLATWLLALWFVIPRLSTAPFLALHYTVYFGVDFIGPPWRVCAAAMVGTIILLVNLAGSSWLYVRERIASALLMSLTVLFEILLFVTTFLVVLLNT